MFSLLCSLISTDVQAPATNFLPMPLEACPLPYPLDPSLLSFLASLPLEVGPQKYSYRGQRGAL